ncbi:MAG: glycosyltransferase family 2 protein [Bacteroidales bacterium]
MVIPAKNEQNNLKTILTSLVNQTVQPQLVLVIDNGSIDQTPAIIKDFASKYPTIHYFHYPGDQSYSLGGKIVRIFNAGKKHLGTLGLDYDYIVKMDADIHFENDLFQKLASRVSAENYGIISPFSYYHQNGRIIFSSNPDWHTIGNFKIYSHQCLEAMGGLREDLGWDCADNVIAMEQGFKTTILRDIVYEERRPIGRFSLLKGWKRQGIGAYKLRYDVLYLFLKATHDIVRPPLLLGSWFYLWGYFSAMLGRQDRILSRPQGKLLRRLFWKSLLKRLKGGNFYMMQNMRKRKQFSG